jgi:hypothetical protein
VTGTSYTDEEAQDAVGSILVDGTTIDFTYNDGTPSITAEVKATSLTNAHINASAAIARSKLDFGSGLVNADIAAAAAIAASKIAAPGSDTYLVFNDGGVLGADAGLSYNKTTDALTVVGVVDAGGLVMDDSEKIKLGTGDDAEIYYDGTNLVIDTQAVGTGALSLTRGQLKFPATQNASTDANTLDDYEEGSWTPVIGGTGGTSGQTYSSQQGRYIKAGRFVWTVCRVTLSNKGTITTTAQIEGLPFTTSGFVNPGGAGVTYFGNLNTAYVALMGLPPTSATTASLYGLTAAATSMSPVPTTDITNTTDLLVVVQYEAAS